jgi:hypothetical protein
MDAPVAAPDALIRPWRRATIVASLIAAVELVVLVVAGFALLAKPLSHVMQQQAQAHAFPAVAKKATRVAPVVVAAPKRTRFQTSVLVLNGNGRSGAASDAATRLRNVGYSIAATGNAPRSDYAATVVMFRAGYRAEALRLARDVHLKVVAPLDGLKPKQLQGAQIAVLLGAG